MQRTPTQSAERRNPFTNQRSHSAEPDPSSGPSHLPLGAEGNVVTDKLYKAQSRAWTHLKSQSDALKKTLERGYESSIKRQINFFTSAYKDYNCVCENAVKDAGLESRTGAIINGIERTYLEYFLDESSELYNNTMLLVDEFFERREKEKAAPEAEALKAAKTQELQRLADNLIEDELDSHGKVSNIEDTATGGPEDADEIQDKIKDLELTLKKLQKAAIELENAAGKDHEALYRQARATRRKAEEKILATVRKLKRRLPSPEGSDAGSYICTYRWKTE
jgi:hypothetical protein